MNGFRSIIAYSILLCISLFLFLNLKDLEKGHGYVFLGVAAILVALLLLLNKNYSVFRKVKASVCTLILFVVYLIINHLYDSMDWQALRNVTIDTSGGVIFGLALGLICSYCLAVIYELRLASKNAYNLTYCLGLVYVFIILYLGVNVFFHHYANVRADLFLITEQHGYYQRAGTFLFIQFMLLVALMSVLLFTSRNIKGFQAVIAVVLPLLVTVVYGLIAQLIGSNSGLVSVCGFLVVFYIYLFVIRDKKARSDCLNINAKVIFCGWIGRKIFLAVMLTLILLTGFLLLLIELADLDVSTFRVMGFGKEGVGDSVDSRIELFKNNFVEQFSYNPIFGHTKVDDLTTGAGTYAHSLISLSSHLGLVGLSIFIIFIYQVYAEITNSCYGSNMSIYSDNRYGLFRLFALGTVLIFAVLTAFYTWLPLWFAIGLFGVGLVYKPVHH